MKKFIRQTIGILLICMCYSLYSQEGGISKNTSQRMESDNNFKSGYAEVNGLGMYYEIYGKGEPLVLIHGGGSTIQSSFGQIIPGLAPAFSLIAMELQNHGRSGFREVPETFEQDADDIAVLLERLGIGKASFFGFSNGASTALQIAIRHPQKVNKLVVASGAVKRSGFIPGFFDGMQYATLSSMPRDLQEAFLKVNPDSARLLHMFEKDRDRMNAFRDWEEADLKSIKAPTLIINGDNDVVLPEHAVELFRLIPGSRLVIIPGTHGEFLENDRDSGEGNLIQTAVVQLVKEFLEKPDHPGN